MKLYILIIAGILLIGTVATAELSQSDNDFVWSLIRDNANLRSQVIILNQTVQNLHLCE